MTVRTLVLAVALAVSTAVATHAQGGAVRSEQDAIIDLERKWNVAFYVEKDLKFIESVLADGYIAVYDDGSRGDKKQELEDARAFDQQVDSAVQDDFTVSLFGDTAIVSFRLRLVGPVQGRTIQTAARYVDVFVKRDNRWQCISSQSTKITSP